MSELRERFEAVLADWAAKRGLGAEAVRLDGRGEVSIDVGESTGTLAYRDESDTVILWFECGPLMSLSVKWAGLRLMDRFSLTGGFTVAYSERWGRVVVHDRHPAERFDSAETLDAWLLHGGDLAKDVRAAAEFGRPSLPEFIAQLEGFVADKRKEV